MMKKWISAASAARRVRRIRIDLIHCLAKFYHSMESCPPGWQPTAPASIAKPMVSPPLPVRRHSRFPSRTVMAGPSLQQSGADFRSPRHAVSARHRRSRLPIRDRPTTGCDRHAPLAATAFALPASQMLRERAAFREYGNCPELLGFPRLTGHFFLLPRSKSELPDVLHAGGKRMAVNAKAEPIRTLHIPESRSFSSTSGCRQRKASPREWRHAIAPVVGRSRMQTASPMASRHR